MQEKDFHLPHSFQLESGGQLPELNVRYHTYGKLNEQRDNVIWICHALTANSVVDDWWSGLFGPGNIFDPEKYFIVCSNNLGSPYGTSSPKHINPQTNERYGMAFPEFTLKDTANIIMLLMDHLELREIYLLIGGSCGGNIALEIAVALDQRIKNLALLCCSARETPWTIAIHHAQRIALEADPDFYNNKPNAGINGLKAARAFAIPFYRNSISMNFRQKEEDDHKISEFKSSSYVSYQGEKFTRRFDAHCYYKLLNALDTHNLGRGKSGIKTALQQIKCNTLVLGIDSDLFIPKEEQLFLVEHMPNAQYKEIKSIYGHDAFLIETEQIKALLVKHLLKVSVDL